MADNDINLAALWVPVLPETSQLKAGLVKAGTEAGAAASVAIRETIAPAAPFKGLGLQLSRELSAGVPEAQRSLGFWWVAGESQHRNGFGGRRYRRVRCGCC